MRRLTQKFTLLVHKEHCLILIGIWLHHHLGNSGCSLFIFLSKSLNQYHLVTEYEKKNTTYEYDYDYDSMTMTEYDYDYDSVWLWVWGKQYNLQFIIMSLGKWCRFSLSKSWLQMAQDFKQCEMLFFCNHKAFSVSCANAEQVFNIIINISKYSVWLLWHIQNEKLSCLWPSKYVKCLPRKCSFAFLTLTVWHPCDLDIRSNHSRSQKLMEWMYNYKLSIR